MKISVIIPTRNRPEKLAVTVQHLCQQDFADGEYEIIVVDDGSIPAVVLPESRIAPACRVVRLEGVERSAARNAGAAEAEGELLIFVDDDITVKSDFLLAHWQAHQEWPTALAVGDIQLPPETLTDPFVRFRQRLENQAVPQSRGIVPARNFCAAANMSLSQTCFQNLGGFDPAMASSEDQDLALRHTAAGGRIVFLPEAEAIHHDSAFDIRSYCRRSEWGMEQMIPFCQRYPEWPQNFERERVNGTARWKGETFAHRLRKAVKYALALKAITEVLFALAWLVERLAPNSRALNRVYRLLLGAHIFRGYRRGRKRSGVVAGTNSHLTEQTMAAVSEQ